MLSSHTCFSSAVFYKSDLSDQLWLPPVCDVILPDVAVQPVTEVKETIVQRDQDVCDQS